MVEQLHFTYLVAVGCGKGPDSDVKACHNAVATPLDYDAVNDVHKGVASSKYPQLKYILMVNGERTLVPGVPTAPDGAGGLCNVQNHPVSTDRLGG